MEKFVIVLFSSSLKFIKPATTDIRADIKFIKDTKDEKEMFELMIQLLKRDGRSYKKLESKIKNAKGEVVCEVKSYYNIILKLKYR